MESKGPIVLALDVERKVCDRKTNEHVTANIVFKLLILRIDLSLT